MPTIYALNDKICFLNGGGGAPQAVDTLETLAELGVKNVISVGMCGVYAESINVGDIIVPEKAFVEEGTSLHYYEEIDFAEPDCDLSKRLRTSLGALSCPIVSTDAVYRQTFRKEEFWREKGAVGVDMETSAVFSVGKYLGINAAAALMASDKHPISPSDEPWKWQITKEMRQKLFEKIIETVLK